MEPVETLPEFLNLFVNVTLHNDGRVTCRPNQLNIPGDAVATITWVPTEDNFTFKNFKWCRNNGWLTQDPIVHDQCAISAVYNTKTDHRGIFRYQLTVAGKDGVEHSTPPCPVRGDGGNGEPKIKNQ